MAITIVRGTGNSGRAAPGFNYYTGGMFYGTAPSGWQSYTHPLYPSVTIKAQQILSAPAALSAGITPFTDNVASTWTSLCTVGDVGDVLEVQVTIPVVGNGVTPGTTTTITLCTYTIAAGVTTLASQGAALAAAINANTFVNGFSASFATATLTLISPANLGISINTGTPYTFTVTPIASPVHTWAFGTQTVGTAGTASTYADAYYQISEYYRCNPTGNLWIGFISASSSWEELLALQLASGNQLRQMWIADTSTTNGLAANLIATTQAIQSIINNVAIIHPVEIVYRPNISAVTNLSTLPNGQTNTNTNNVQVLISQDGAAQGAFLYTLNGYSISNIGANCGVLSASRISSCIAQPIQANNVSNGIENNTPAVSNGTLNSAISVSLYQQLFGTVSTNTSGYCYIGFSVYPGNASGTFFSGNAMFITSSSDYAYMNDNRVWDAVTRIIQQAYTPYLSSEIQYNAQGEIDNLIVVALQNVGINAIVAGMITGINPAYISGTPIVEINPAQNVQATNTLNVGVSIEENGIIRNIVVTNAFSN